MRRVGVNVGVGVLVTEARAIAVWVAATIASRVCWSRRSGVGVNEEIATAVRVCIFIRVAAARVARGTRVGLIVADGSPSVRELVALGDTGTTVTVGALDKVANGRNVGVRVEDGAKAILPEDPGSTVLIGLAKLDDPPPRESSKTVPRSTTI